MDIPLFRKMLLKFFPYEKRIINRKSRIMTVCFSNLNEAIELQNGAFYEHSIVMNIHIVVEVVLGE